MSRKPSAYNLFVKEHLSSCTGTPQEKMKKVASMYKTSKYCKPKSSGGLLSGAALPSGISAVEDNMQKLKIFKDKQPPYIPKKESPQTQTGGLLSGAGGLGC